MSAASPILTAQASSGAVPSPFELFEDRRAAVRQERAVTVHLLRDDGALIGPCRTNNVSLHGLHLTVPVGYGVAVGQRYEVRINAGDGPSHDVVDTAYATIVRTQVVTDGDHHCVHVGLRLDQPVYLFS